MVVVISMVGGTGVCARACACEVHVTARRVAWRCVRYELAGLAKCAEHGGAGILEREEQGAAPTRHPVAHAAIALADKDTEQQQCVWRACAWVNRD